MKFGERIPRKLPNAPFSKELLLPGFQRLLGLGTATQLRERAAAWKPDGSQGEYRRMLSSSEDASLEAKKRLCVIQR